ncbi:hypothetical protein [Microvirus mar62]|uniref:Uncharacterized protein n=1 Tax=Microvirus mar62 TaxID=2851199 RepID=A0A8F5MKH4_9VIRU|nr:hypothetical protein [Microvirus mar62]
MEEKKFLCSIQSKITPSVNETLLVSASDIASFVDASLSADKVIIISQCAIFQKIDDHESGDKK